MKEEKPRGKYPYQLPLTKFFGAFGSFSFYSIQHRFPIELSGMKDISNKIKEGFSVGF